MKRNKKDIEEKALRRECMEHIGDTIFHSWPQDKVPYEVRKMIKVKIGVSSWETKGARLWRQYKEKSAIKKTRQYGQRGEYGIEYEM